MKQLFITLLLVVSLVTSYLLITSDLKKQAVEPTEYHISMPESSSPLNRVTHLSNYSAIVDKPLFIQSRTIARKAPQKKTVQKVVKQQKLNIKALGIALAGDGLIAVIKDLNNGRVMRLHLNDELHGWALARVADGQLSFKKGSTEKIVKFRN